MREIQLTQSKVALVDDEDFENVNAYKWFAAFDGKNWYAGRKLPRLGAKQLSQAMHRFIMGLEYGDPREVDHKNCGETLDNRRSNLRVTLDQNSQNRRMQKNNKSGFKGVFWNNKLGKWQSGIQANGKKIHLELFPTIELAVDAYDTACVEYHKNFAVTNKMLTAVA